MNVTPLLPNMLRPVEVCKRLGISRSTLYHWVDQGRFPHPVLVGPGVRGWREDVLRRWLAEREKAVA